MAGRTPATVKYAVVGAETASAVTHRTREPPMPVIPGGRVTLAAWGRDRRPGRERPPARPPADGEVRPRADSLSASTRTGSNESGRNAGRFGVWRRPGGLVVEAADSVSLVYEIHVPNRIQPTDGEPPSRAVSADRGPERVTVRVANTARASPNHRLRGPTKLSAGAPRERDSSSPRGSSPATSRRSASTRGARTAESWWSSFHGRLITPTRAA